MTNMTDMNSLINGTIGGLGIILIIFCLFLISIYFLPTLIVIFKKSKHPVAVLLLNVFLGWTFLGWIIALILSLQSEDKTIYIYNNVQSGSNDAKHVNIGNSNKSIKSKKIKEDKKIINEPKYRNFGPILSRKDPYKAKITDEDIKKTDGIIEYQKIDELRQRY